MRHTNKIAQALVSPLVSLPVVACAWLAPGKMIVASGPEKIVGLGTPRRTRKVYAIRRFDIESGIATGGFSWEADLDDACAVVRKARVDYLKKDQKRC